MFKKIRSTWRASRSSISQGGRSLELTHVFSSCISLGTRYSRRHWILSYIPGSASKKPPFHFLPALTWPLLGKPEHTGRSRRGASFPSSSLRVIEAFQMQINFMAVTPRHFCTSSGSVWGQWSCGLGRDSAACKHLSLTGATFYLSLFRAKALKPHTQAVGEENFSYGELQV